jgi:hypothetical protein
VDSIGGGRSGWPVPGPAAFFLGDTVAAVKAWSKSAAVGSGLPGEGSSWSCGMAVHYKHFGMNGGSAVRGLQTTGSPLPREIREVPHVALSARCQ